MPILALLDRRCDIWGSILMNPETEDAKDVDAIVFPNVACRVDSILYRRSIESTVSGGEQGIRRGIIFIQDPRLSYPDNFDENNWIVQDGIRYEILSIDEADDMFTMHHFEVNVQGGRFR